MRPSQAVLYRWKSHQLFSKTSICINRKKKEMVTLSKHKLLSIFSVLIIASMVLTACASATQTEAPTSTAMPKPATYTPMPVGGEATATVAPTEAATEAATEASTTASGGETNAFGVTLPADAAPVDQQVLRLMGPEGTTTDFAVSVYKRSVNSYSDILNVPFVRLNKNFEIQPAGALSWEVSTDGKTWTFHMDPDLKWSDGNPVTADDVVFTFQYQADPTHAWDFAWFWSDVVNFDDAVAGKVDKTEIGVKKVDDFTVQFMTKDASPYFVSKALYIRPLSKAAFEKYGEYYNSTPETSVSSSPYILTEWTKGKGMTFGPNKNYTGKEKPFIEKLIFTFSDNTNQFRAYQNGEIDQADVFTPADIEQISNDTDLNAQYHPGYGDFRTYYLGFNNNEKPFNDIKVRQAFAKAIDKDAIIKNIVKRAGIKANSFLMPGFPDANSEELAKEDVNTYDVAAAQKLMADAGYPNGQGFPKLELWLRQESDLNKAVAGAIASQLQENLGIQVEVSNKETKLFMDTLNSHKLTFYFLSYGFDYLDPSNMLGIWKSGGRHAWTNDKFDSLITEATSLVGDTAKRDQEFMDAEKILVEDVGGVFIYHATPGAIYKPYVKGSELEPDKTGVSAWHWPNTEAVGELMFSLYISKDAPADRITQ
jgi:peptide/nickel transport system substrate-binding protein/oligopeptide transport system substrate-binding protein